MRRPLGTAARPVRSAGELASAIWILSGWRSRLSLVGLRLGWTGRPEREVVPLRLRPLGGRALWVRPGTSDAAVIVEDFVRGFADPPVEVAGQRLARIVELGSNIGAGLALLAHRYPDASLLGVEADAGNAALARRNLAPWADRCRLVEAAVWEGPGDPVIDRSGGRESGFTIGPSPGRENSERLSVPARSVDVILSDFHPGEPIDYLYMDLEGTHARLLGDDPSWVRRVGVIKVAGHVQTPYSEADCASDLQRLGFRTRVVSRDPIGWTIGVRPGVPQRPPPATRRGFAPGARRRRPNVAGR